MILPKLVEMESKKISNNYVFVVTPQSTLAESISLFLDFDIDHLPVLRGSSIEGVITPKSILSYLSKNNDVLSLNHTVDAVPLQKPAVLRPEAPIAESIMKLQKGHEMVVLSSEHIIRGSITCHDILDTNFLWLNKENHHLDESFLLPLKTMFEQQVSLETSLSEVITRISRSPFRFIPVFDAETQLWQGFISGKMILHQISNLLSYSELEQFDNIDTITVVEMHPIMLKKPILIKQVRYALLETLTVPILDEDNFPSDFVIPRSLLNYLHI